MELERLMVGEPEAEDLERRHLIRRAVEKLPDLQRKVIELFFWEDLSQTEIARMMGVSVTYVSYLYRKALTNLRRMLVGEGKAPEAPKRRRPRRKKKRGGR